MSAVRLTDEEIAALLDRRLSPARAPYLCSLGSGVEREAAVRTAARGLVARRLLLPDAGPDHPLRVRADLRRLLHVLELPDLTVDVLRVTADGWVEVRAWSRDGVQVVEDREVGHGIHELRALPARRLSAAVAAHAGDRAARPVTTRCEVVVRSVDRGPRLLAVDHREPTLRWCPIDLAGTATAPPRAVPPAGLEQVIDALLRAEPPAPAIASAVIGAGGAR